jgi:hypothetical protein
MPGSAAAEVSGSVHGSTAVCPRMAAGGHAVRTPTVPTPTSSWPSSPIAALPDHCVRPPARHGGYDRGVCIGRPRVRCGGRRAVLVRTPVQGLRWPRTPRMSTDISVVACPDASRPDAGRSGSSGRSIRRLLTAAPSDSLQLPLSFLKAGSAGGSTSPVPGRADRRSRTTAALTLKCAPVNLDS